MLQLRLEKRLWSRWLAQALDDPRLAGMKSGARAMKSHDDWRNEAPVLGIRCDKSEILIGTINFFKIPENQVHAMVR